MDAEYAWAAGLFEGEGFISLNNNCMRLGLGMRDEDVVRRFWNIVGHGNVLQRSDGMWMWQCGAREAVHEIWSWLSPMLGERRLARFEELLQQRKKVTP